MLVVSVLALGHGTSAAQVAGVLLVGAGVLLVRGLKKPPDPHALWFALGIAAVIASYTLLDKRGITHANPITYLELSMVPAALGYALAVFDVRGRTGMRAELNIASILAGSRRSRRTHSSWPRSNARRRRQWPRCARRAS